MLLINYIDYINNKRLMHYVKCIFNDNLLIDSSNIISFTLENDSNNSLKASIIIYKTLNNELIDGITNCNILINNKKYFEGNIKSIQIDNNYINIIATNENNKSQTLESNVIKENNKENNNKAKNNKKCNNEQFNNRSSNSTICNGQHNNNELYNNAQFNNKLIERFKINNPSLFPCSTNYSNYYNNENIIKNMENKIIKDSLKINIDKSLPIGELDLNISASWNKLCTGYCDLTNKIKNKLNNGLISTLTPKKLIKSWPKLFDRLISNNKGPLKTKYFIYNSKLEEINKNIIMINNNKLYESQFDFKLSIGWEYYQFVTENLHCKIINNTVNNSNKQPLNINLHNVQEYIEDNTCNNFFQSNKFGLQSNTNIGNSIVNLILNEVQQFIINSMQNITIQFQIPFTDTLKINNKIQINNYIGIINKIEILFKKNKTLANITCIASEYNNAFTKVKLQNLKYNSKYNKEDIFKNTIIEEQNNNRISQININNNNANTLQNSIEQNNKNIMQNNTKQCNDNLNIVREDIKQYNNNLNIDQNNIEKNTYNDIIDIIENIDILNTSNEQINKIENIKDLKQINNILNENQTKLIIMLKPIKKEHNEIKNIDIGIVHI